MNKTKVERIEWIDPESHDGWTELKSISTNFDTIVTYGCVQVENDHCILIAASLDEDAGTINHSITIPKTLIKSRMLVYEHKEKTKIRTRGNSKRSRGRS